MEMSDRMKMEERKEIGDRGEMDYTVEYRWGTGWTSCLFLSTSVPFLLPFSSLQHLSLPLYSYSFSAVFVFPHSFFLSLSLRSYAFSISYPRVPIPSFLLLSFFFAAPFPSPYPTVPVPSFLLLSQSCSSCSLKAQFLSFPLIKPIVKQNKTNIFYLHPCFPEEKNYFFV